MEYNKPSYNNQGFKPKQPWNNNNNFTNKAHDGAPREPVVLPEPKFYKPYAGTGNPNTPTEIASQIKRIAAELDSLGFTVRTGGCDGTEEVFENSATNVELHLPGRGFGKKESKFTFVSPMAKAIARQFQPSYDSLPVTVHAFLAKNVRLILGTDLKSRAMFLLCWSEDGAESTIARTSKTGNVGHAIAIASALKIPVFNLAKPDAEKRLKDYIGIPMSNQPSNFDEI